MELVSPLAGVVGIGGGDVAAPVHALDLGGRERVWAGVAGDDAGVSLEVDVEPGAGVDVVTPASALLGVVGLKGAVAGVTVGTVGGLQVFEGLEVAAGHRGGGCRVREHIVGKESVGVVRAWDGPGASGKGSARIVSSGLDAPLGYGLYWKGVCDGGLSCGRQVIHDCMGLLSDGDRVDCGLWCGFEEIKVEQLARLEWRGANQRHQGVQDNSS